MQEGRKEGTNEQRKEGRKTLAKHLSLNLAWTLPGCVALNKSEYLRAGSALWV